MIARRGIDDCESVRILIFAERVRREDGGRDPGDPGGEWFAED